MIYAVEASFRLNFSMIIYQAEKSLLKMILSKKAANKTLKAYMR